MEHGIDLDDLRIIQAALHNHEAACRRNLLDPHNPMRDDWRRDLIATRRTLRKVTDAISNIEIASFDEVTGID